MTDAERLLFRETLLTAATAQGMTLTEKAVEDCLTFTERLLEENTRQNLTRITDPAEVAVKHFADSFTVLQACPDLVTGATVADVGTGAGFPGIPLKILRPDLSLTLLDSLAKRLTFLRDAVENLGMNGVAFVHTRAEDAGRRTDFRDTFDVVTARAVAALPVLLEWCGPLVRVDGYFVAMKAASADEELAAAGTAAQTLGLRLVRDLSVTLPAIRDLEESAQRRLLVYRKQRATPARYPRRAAEIKAQPLGAVTANR
jgi:16S rRNA (guanine527-N7)-methyltransferase